MITNVILYWFIFLYTEDWKLTSKLRYSKTISL